MWIVAGVLLGLVVLASLIGFHTGPHAHVAAAAFGAVAAIWLLVMALDGRASAVVWTLFSADVVVSGGVGVMAWSGLRWANATGHSYHLGRIEGTSGTAVSDLSPEGIVRVRGEEWSATSVNGRVRAGTAVQVVRAAGVRLEVWGEETDELGQAAGGPTERPVPARQDVSTQEGSS
jgi:membrane-bound ClpP family serine protease